MPLITNKKEVLGIYAEAAQRKWVIPCICSENLTTTEAILSAVKDFGENIGVHDLPITVAITNCYPHRSQSINYTHTQKWEVGLRLFIEDLKILTSSLSPYKDLRVMLHLDHVQYDVDKALFDWDMKQFSSIMFDASTLSFEENIKITGRFVKKHQKIIAIEGVCDEINDSGAGGNELTTPENAEKYIRQTGCDFIVASLGTEHRANVAEMKYYGELARKIKEKIGAKIVLHGASSVNLNQIIHLFDDGVCKVNIWTILERDSALKLFERMLCDASKIIGTQKAVDLQKQGLLGEKADINSEKSIHYYTTLYRQQIIFEEMKKIVYSFLSVWYV